ncbi:MAG: tRNA adenosine(34) deaminase TadA [Candidatus Omnitrophota bacterium]|nr:tRNA adenosine(34) deaminase TadA [Candidatus Omnitrophota bacterium]
MNQTRNQFYMQEALRQARIAFTKDEVPVGVVIVHKGKIVSRAYNQVELLKDPTAHAEMLAITQATNFLGTKWLLDCEIYVTIEPCSMCAGALVLARMKNIYFGAKDPKTGACGSVVNIAENKKLNHRIKIKGGILEAECSSLLREFFQRKRRQQAAINN